MSFKRKARRIVMAKKTKKESTDTAFTSYLEIVEIYHPEDGRIDIELPRLTTGKMSDISESLANLIDAVSDKAPEGLLDAWTGKSKDIDEGDLGLKIIKLLPQIFPIVLKEVIELLAAYLDEPVEWVRQLSTEDLSKIFSPFLTSILANMTQLLSMIGLSNVIRIRPGTVSETTVESTAEIVEEAQMEVLKETPQQVPVDVPQE
jgi:hypothetical protein